MINNILDDSPRAGSPQFLRRFGEFVNSILKQSFSNAQVFHISSPQWRYQQLTMTSAEIVLFP